MLFLSQLMIRIYLSQSENLFAAPKSDTLLFKRPKDSVHRANDPHSPTWLIQSIFMSEPEADDGYSSHNNVFRLLGAQGP